MFHSGFLTDDGGWDNRPIHEQEDNFKRFTELIVRECAGVVADAVDHREPASTYVSKITQHFGVK